MSECLKRPTAGIILAAGMSQRFGSPKQLLEFRGKYLIEWVMDAALHSDLESLILVLGHHFRDILQALGEKVSPRIHVIVNHRYSEGQSGSLRTGLLKTMSLTPEWPVVSGQLSVNNGQRTTNNQQDSATGKGLAGFPSAMFLLGDQPFVDAELINWLLDRFRRSDKDICVPVCHGKRGNPTLFTRAFYPQLLNIRGDVGGRQVIQAHPESVLYVVIDNPLYLQDIDTSGDVERLMSVGEA